MRSQPERDQQTITIATGLAIFAGTLLVGLLLGVLVIEIRGLSGSAISGLGIALVFLAAMLSLAYVVRHRRS